MTFAPHSPLRRLLAGPMRTGRVTWIGLRPARRADMRMVDAATLIEGQGLNGDRTSSTHDGPRQVTLIAAEDLAAIAAFLGRDGLDPALLRRNIVTTGINLLALTVASASAQRCWQALATARHARTIATSMPCR